MESPSSHRRMKQRWGAGVSASLGLQPSSRFCTGEPFCREPDETGDLSDAASRDGKVKRRMGGNVPKAEWSPSVNRRVHSAQRFYPGQLGINGEACPSRDESSEARCLARVFQRRGIAPVSWKPRCVSGPVRHAPDQCQ
ncbi:hypothetical protein AAFF_G00183250 [Aldrovandia affinis]|uniref:Uncharacterized protein n=1 Tax=Aldrovandia affinis TaxID=143900 RepID=A0AAD7W701_9TELE|nr:hypothetical protein AAFF_G00183250 [Aldrovandia affinis]